MIAHKIRPLGHRVVVELTPLLSDGRFEVGVGWKPPSFYHPLEVPRYVRKRLIDFLRGEASVAPAFLDGLLPASEIPSARRTFRALVDAGVEESEALLTMGVLDKARVPSVPPLSVARVIRSGCRCLAVEYALIGSSSGEEIDGPFRVVSCCSLIAETGARTYRSVQDDERCADSRRRAAFAAARGLR